MFFVLSAHPTTVLLHDPSITPATTLRTLQDTHFGITIQLTGTVFTAS